MTYIKFYLLFIVFLFVSAILKGETNVKEELNLLFKEVEMDFFSKNNHVEIKAQKAVQLAIDLKDSSKLADLYRMLGVMVYFSGKHKEALGYYYKAIEIYQKINNKSGEARTYNEIGTVYKKNNRLEDALKMFDMSRQIALAIHDTANMATAISNAGIVFEMRNDFGNALSHYFRSLKLYEAIKDTIGLSYSYENIGGVYLLQNKYALAETNLLISLDYRKIKHLDQATAFSYHYLGEVYQQKGDQTKAIEMFNLCLKVAEKINFPDIKQRACFSLSAVYKQSGKYQQAIDYFEKATLIKDSLFNVARSLQITEIQTKYEVENKIKENLLLKKTLDLEGQKARNMNLLIFFIVFTALGLIAGGVIYYNRKRQLENLQTSLKIQKAEHEQRVRISHDLHDNVGAQLSYVVSNLDIATSEFNEKKIESKRLESVTEMSKKAISTLRETVWALNNESISVESFSDKFKSYTLKMSEFSNNLNIEFVEELKEEGVLLPDTALNLFRICQEAFSNSLKHSGATSLRIEIKSDIANIFSFRLADNGVGFNEDVDAKRGHYGLQNMKSRALQVGAEFNIVSDPRNGTEIFLNLKTNTNNKNSTNA